MDVKLPPYVQCRCGAMILRGLTDYGQALAVETGVMTYLVDWMPGQPTPRLVQSRAYPIHTCAMPEEHHHAL